MVEPLRHRQTKGAATDMFYLTPTAPHLDSTNRYRVGPPASPAMSANRRGVEAGVHGCGGGFIWISIEHYKTLSSECTGGPRRVLGSLHRAKRRSRARTKRRSRARTKRYIRAIA